MSDYLELERMAEGDGMACMTKAELRSLLVDNEHLSCMLESYKIDAKIYKDEAESLRNLLDTPYTSDWFDGVKLEAGHQIKRFGVDHDAGKTPADWFWLVGYLAQKAMIAQMANDEDKAKHHTISTGAAMLNWFRAITGESTDMRPGISSPENPS